MQKVADRHGWNECRITNASSAKLHRRRSGDSKRSNLWPQRICCIPVFPEPRHVMNVDHVCVRQEVFARISALRDRLDGPPVCSAVVSSQHMCGWCQLTSSLCIIVRLTCMK